MLPYLREILLGQYEAALCMLDHCLRACPPEHWQGKIAACTFQEVAYHTLFFTDYYLSPSDTAFSLRDLNLKGGDERALDVSPGLSQTDTLAYLTACRTKLVQSLAAETSESLQAPAAFPRRTFSRGELHIYNIRHIQHHTGQLSAFLRRTLPAFQDPAALPWVGKGWK
jgi:hypothetical protein